ncbi:MAG: transporter substrate-binding domain-containing protein [Nonomuraea sp.]|nr:transporter substrate-binding domain-containing protein [Nonomuraea sp.]
MSGRLFRAGRRRLLPATVTAAVLLLAACSGGGGDTQASSDGKVATVQKGVLTIGSQQSYIPGEFRAEGSQDLQGFGVEIVDEIAKRLGLKTQWVQVDYSAIITGLQAGQFDMGSGGMSPNPERLQQVDMVGYYQSGATFLVRKADAGKYTTAKAVCGQKLGMLEGSTTLEKAVEKENAACGGGPIQVEHYTSTPLGLQGLLSERIAAYAPDLAQAQYIVRENPDQFATTDYHLVDYLINFTFVKDKGKELRDAVYAQLDAMMKDGTYDRILARWNLAVGGLKQPAYNGELDAKPSSP